jgi:hypothetical protein
MAEPVKFGKKEFRGAPSALALGFRNCFLPDLISEGKSMLLVSPCPIGAGGCHAASSPAGPPEGFKDYFYVA